MDRVDGAVDLTLREVPGPATFADAPESAQHYLAGPWQVAVWVPSGGFHPGIRSAVEGPGGRGGAWLSAPPNALGMQLGGALARIGDDEVLLRRNRPRLRRRNRVIRVVGENLRWAMILAAGSAQLVDEATDEVVWRRDGAQRSGSVGLSADQVAMVLLLDHVGIESTAGGPLRLLRNL